MAQPTKAVLSLPRPQLPLRSLASQAGPRSTFASVLGGSLRANRSRHENRGTVTREDAGLGPEATVFMSEVASSKLPAAPYASKPDLENVFAVTVSRIAWGGVPHGPLVHIELASGSELHVERNARGIRVRLSGLSAADRDRYREAIERRLRVAELAVDEIDVE